MHQSSPHFSSNFSSNPSLQISSMSVSSPMPPASVPTFGNSFDKHGLKNGLAPQASLNRLQQLIDALDSSLRLPNTPRAFTIYLAGLAIVFAGAFMHVLIAAQIMQAEFTLNQLQEEYLAIEQQNGDIIFQIARDTNMARLQERVLAQGYVPVQEREYIFVPSESLADVELAHTGEQASTGNSTTASTTASKMTSTAANPASATEPTGVDGSSFNWSWSDLNWNTTGNGGQFAHWEEFWNRTWRSATGTGVGIPSSITPDTLPDTTTGSIASSSSQASNAMPSFWSTWWEQASAQGSKLLEQFLGQ